MAPAGGGGVVENEIGDGHAEEKLRKEGDEMGDGERGGDETCGAR